MDNDERRVAIIETSLFNRNEQTDRQTDVFLGSLSLADFTTRQKHVANDRKTCHVVLASNEYSNESFMNRVGGVSSDLLL